MQANRDENDKRNANAEGRSYRVTKTKHAREALRKLKHFLCINCKKLCSILEREDYPESNVKTVVSTINKVTLTFKIVI